jgi:hypothetical protein
MLFLSVSTYLLKHLDLQQIFFSCGLTIAENPEIFPQNISRENANVCIYEDMVLYIDSIPYLFSSEVSPFISVSVTNSVEQSLARGANSCLASLEISVVYEIEAYITVFK